MFQKWVYHSIMLSLTTYFVNISRAKGFFLAKNRMLK